MKLDAQLKLADIQNEANVASLLTEDDLGKIGNHVLETYNADKSSRAKWEKKNQEANDLALQVVENKSYPWENSSNVKFPLLTIACLQFASRAYPALIKAPDLVKFRVQGKDEGGIKAARAQRISAHMSYQLLDQDEDWEEEQDKAYMALPITGCVFKKSFYDPVIGHNRSRTVLPMSLVVHYYAKSLETAARKTEIFQLYDREIKERVLKGVYLDHDLAPAPVQNQGPAEEREGRTPPASDPDRPRMLLEQHRHLDLDDDGYGEPYVVTVDQETKKVFRIVHRFKEVITEQSIQIARLEQQKLDLAQSVMGQERPPPEALQRIDQTITRIEDEIEMLSTQKPSVLRIQAVEHYTKIPFIPSPDGGFYDIGFGQLLSPLNESVNTLINQLIDSGTLQNGSVGFIGKGARIKGGKVRFSPNEWKRVDVAGATLRDSLVPLPVNQPSAVLFNLLGLLVQYTEKVSSVTDTMTGENPGQNTPAYNMRAMEQNGLQVFNGIFKRVYRALRSEFRKLYALNAIYLDENEYFEYQDLDKEITRDDYKSDPKDLMPAADPNAFANEEKQMKAIGIAERASIVPGYDPIKIEQRFLEAMDIADANELYPTQQNPETGAIELVLPPGPSEDLQIELAKEQRLTLDSKSRTELAAQETAGKLALIEAQIFKTMQEAQAIGAEVETDRYALILKEVSDQRKDLTERAKIDASKETSGVGGKSDHDGDS